MSVSKIFAEADKAGKEVTELTSGLVKFNTAHPEGRTDEIVPYIAQYLEKHGIEHDVYAQDPKKPNIVAKLPGKSKSKILWMGHVDVVPEGKPERARARPIHNRIRLGDGRRITSPFTCEFLRILSQIILKRARAALIFILI